MVSDNHLARVRMPHQKVKSFLSISLNPHPEIRPMVEFGPVGRMVEGNRPGGVDIGDVKDLQAIVAVKSPVRADDVFPVAPSV